MARPLNPAFQNSALAKLQDLRSRYGSMDNYLDQAHVQCIVQANNSIYVSAEGHVLPCCWLAGQVRDPSLRKRTEILELLDVLGGPAHIDGRLRSIRAIVERRGRFFQKLVPGSWSKPSCAEGKLRTCSRVCGHDFKRFEAQSPLDRIRPRRRARVRAEFGAVRSKLSPNNVGYDMASAAKNILRDRRPQRL